MNIKKIELPEKSVLSKEKENFDYIDSFEGKLTDTRRSIDITEVGKAFFTSGPKWGKKMFAFRNKVVSLFGLKTGTEATPAKASDDFTCEIGERIGLFKIFGKTNNEIILGEDDKHLDFRVSLLFDKDKGQKDVDFLTISTTVKYHNWLGILYFLPVRPFHKLIVSVMLKNMIGQLENGK
ncbi:DUF2867 domain-containing protein [Chryseobacterium joostei]|uniref:DUF2867 domain-containing protein n=1 Tax=Chryseobacterium joostei TaxID=112234 RepID=A0A1N7HVU2_9FLAO|nr:DUF2867 domain-containing protein [Chryseobacterium joostei]AZA98950.1 DUF2867 domain-containing protein [Chryseobacterium joostei]SIS28881.1 Protein of unknown function [Chryseobacterium joostei]